MIDQTTTPKTLDINQILEILPHRPPFVFVDRILSYDPGKSIIGVKNITMNEPTLVGHFPGEPVFPGVLIVEGIAQTAGILAFKSGISKEHICLFSTIDETKFRVVVRPGDRIIFKVTAEKLKPRATKFSGEAYVDDKLVAQSKIMLSFPKKPK